MHKYLQQRLMAFDHETLYELHYLSITLGKVFCQKRQPNCGQCPMQEQCDYARHGGPRLQVGNRSYVFSDMAYILIYDAPANNLMRLQGSTCK